MDISIIGIYGSHDIVKHGPLITPSLLCIGNRNRLLLWFAGRDLCSDVVRKCSTAFPCFKRHR